VEVRDSNYYHYVPALTSKCAARLEPDSCHSRSSGAFKNTPGDAKCVTEIICGDKNKEVRGGGRNLVDIYL